MKSAGHVLGFYFAAVFFSTKGDAVIDMDKFIFFLYESLLYVGIMFHFANVQRRNYVGILPSLIRLQIYLPSPDSVLGLLCESYYAMFMFCLAPSFPEPRYAGAT